MEVREMEKLEPKFKLLTVQQVADYLGYCPGTVYNMISEGTFPIKPKRIGRGRGSIRFDQRELDSYIEASTGEK
jgi:excisionase family DNA binding protein